MKNKEQTWSIPKGETHIPAEVRYSKQISYASKLIYGDICALSFKHGYCDAGNDYFAFIYGVDDKTISDWVNQLFLAGFVKRKLLKGYKRHLTPVIGKITEKIILKDGGETATTESCFLPQNESSKGDKIQQDTNTKIIQIENPPAEPIGKDDKSFKLNSDIKFLISKFESVDPVNKRHYGNKVQREACKFLLEEYGEIKIKTAISNILLARERKETYFPVISTPLDLVNKWQKLKDAIERLSTNAKQNER
jgi:hypothetical protein